VAHVVPHWLKMRMTKLVQIKHAWLRTQMRVRDQEGKCARRRKNLPGVQSVHNLTTNTPRPLVEHHFTAETKKA
jgi:hypothetical protein